MADDIQYVECLRQLRPDGGFPKVQDVMNWIVPPPIPNNSILDGYEVRQYISPDGQDGVIILARIKKK